MTPERFQIIRDLFDQAADLPESQRGPFLDGACGSDADLRRQVDRLLGRLDGFVPSVDASAVPTVISRAWSQSSPAPIPARIGQYRVLTPIGQGGMGNVYQAQQENPARFVALKIMRLDTASPETLRRFLHEADVLARLRHPGIACIFESGLADTPDGRRPFIAMELIRGLSLIAHATSASLDLPARVALFIRVCDAVEHAHQAGVVHRDLKPANILVDQDGQPKIVDFGVAAADSPAAPQRPTMHTRAGQVIGTLSYMSPEQIVGQSGAASARSDVYSLGVVLFELLTGRLPLDLRERPLPETARIVRDEDPSRLSTIDARLRGDLDTVVAKCLEKDPLRRYASAGSLGDDLRRFLADEPILARPPSTSYQARKFIRRHKELVLGISAAFLMLLGGIIATTVLAVRAERLRSVAERNEAAARWESYRNAISAADRAIQVNDAVNAVRVLDAAPVEHRGWEWSYLKSISDQSLLAIQAHTGRITGLGVDLDRGVAFSTGDDGDLKCWDLHTRAARWVVPAHPRGGSVALILAHQPDVLITQGADGAIAAWSPQTGQPLWSMPAGRAGRLHPQSLFRDQQRIAVAIESRVAFLDVPTGKELSAFPLPLPGGGKAAVDSHAQRLAVDLRGQVVVFDLATGAELYRVPSLPFAWAGRSVNQHSTDRPPTSTDPGSSAHTSNNTTDAVDLRENLWILSSGTRELVGNSLAVSHPPKPLAKIENVATLIPMTTRERLVGVGGPGGVFVAEPAGPRADNTTRGPAGRAAPPAPPGPATSPGATASLSVLPLRGPTESITAAALAPGQERIATGDHDGVIRLWTTDPRGLNFSVDASNDIILGGVASPDGSRLATAGWGSVKLWDTATGYELATAVPMRREVHGLAFDSSGQRLFASSSDPQIVCLDAASARVLATANPLPTAGTAVLLAWHAPTSSLIAAAAGPRGASVFIIDPDTLATRHRVDVPILGLTSLAASRTGELVALATRDSAVWLFSPSRPDQPLRPLLSALSNPEPIRNMPNAAFADDGSMLACVRNDGTIVLVDPNNAATRWTRPNFSSDRIGSVAFTPDGGRLFVGSSEGSIGVFSADTGDKMVILRQLAARIVSLDFAADRLVACVQIARSSWQIVGGPVTLDNIQQREHRLRAESLVADLIARHRFVDDALAALRLNDSIPEPVRATAAALLVARGDHPNYLNGEAWGIVRFPNRTPDEYRLALKLARRACQIRPSSYAFANTLGFALLRVGEFQPAADAILLSMRLRRDQGLADDPVDLFALAMARRALGDADQAHTDFARARELMRDPPHRDNAESIWIDSEARRVFGQP